MVALSARRLVCAAIELISSTTSPIFCTVVARPETIEVVSDACPTAVSEISRAWLTCRLISPTEAASSSAPAATACTLAVVWVEALAAEVACSLAFDTACMIWPRSPSISRWMAWRRICSLTSAVTSVANFTTLNGLPFMSRMGL